MDDAVADCTACKKAFATFRDVPDEWQCSCGGAVKEREAEARREGDDG